ncbi:hypothetical protein TELCIR_25862 [Teladorsagia circumcincta]|uniref:Uncharacterized protein n=1 Tax=Teladorsagia circumcincta TaxID=45464 RepID=A0A2G9T4G3_TELCI|nr:hypothetical protein TELCIR_25862 [Teladorsagia circumcincta]
MHQLPEATVAAEGLVGEKIREEQIIEENAEYAEGVHQGDEEDSNAPEDSTDAESMEESIPELVEDEEFEDEEDLQEDVNAPENDQRDEGDAQEDDPRDLGNAPQNDPQNEQRAPEGEAEDDPPHVVRLRRIEWEVRSARQVIIDLDDIVAELYKEETCPSRKSRNGKITKRERGGCPAHSAASWECTILTHAP